jgi:hypothetical protein
MADWPSAEEIAQVIDIGDQAGWDWNIAQLREAAIYRVKQDVGVWDELLDEPDDSLSRAAMRMCELITERPEAATAGTNDPTYLRLLYGHRKRFAIS